MAAIHDDLLQSEGWERFQRSLGRKTERVDGCLIICLELPFQHSYLYSPRAPFAVSHEIVKGRFGRMVQRGCSLGREIGSIFWRGSFSESLLTRHAPLVTPRVMRRALEPEWTWRVSLAASPDDIIATMHEKHRYNVRLAERRGVRVDQVSGSLVDRGHLDVFRHLLQSTAQRQEIATHPRAYYETMLRELSRKPQAASRKQESDCFLYLAERKDVPCASAIIAYHGDTATYLHGGSSYEYRQYMAPFALHWHAMRDAKAAGMRWYDFGGISAPEARDLKSSMLGDRWSGMTRFKRGFGGETVHHPPMRDLVFRRGRYMLLAALARIRA